MELFAVNGKRGWILVQSFRKKLRVLKNAFTKTLCFNLTAAKNCGVFFLFLQLINWTSATTEGRKVAVFTEFSTSLNQYQHSLFWYFYGTSTGTTCGCWYYRYLFWCIVRILGTSIGTWTLGTGTCIGTTRQTGTTTSCRYFTAVGICRTVLGPSIGTRTSGTGSVVEV